MWALMRQGCLLLKLSNRAYTFLGDSTAIDWSMWPLVLFNNECINLLRHCWTIMPIGVQKKFKPREGVCFHQSSRIIVAAWDSVLRRILRSPLGSVEWALWSINSASLGKKGKNDFILVHTPGICRLDFQSQSVFFPFSSSWLFIISHRFLYAPKHIWLTPLWNFNDELSSI